MSDRFNLIANGFDDMDEVISFLKSLDHRWHDKLSFAVVDTGPEQTVEVKELDDLEQKVEEWFGDMFDKMYPDQSDDDDFNPA